MTHYESAIDEIAGRLQGTGASLMSSIAEILAAALQELIEAKLTGAIGVDLVAPSLRKAELLLGSEQPPARLPSFASVVMAARRAGRSEPPPNGEPWEHVPSPMELVGAEWPPRLRLLDHE